MPMPYKTSMQFKGVGNLFDDGEFSKSFFSIGKLFKDSNFKKANSISDLQGTVLDNFNKQFHISSEGISEWSKAQIEAKSSAIGLKESLTNEVVAMAKDASITDKIKTGKLTWIEALDKAGNSVDEFGDALLKSGKLSDNSKNVLENVLGSDKSIDDKRQAMRDVINATDDLKNSIANVESVSSKSGIFSGAKNFGKEMLLNLKSFITTAGPYIAAIGAVVGAWELFKYSSEEYTRAQENMDSTVSDYKEEQSNLDTLNSKYDEQKSKIEELQVLKSSGNITNAQDIELQSLQNQNSELERQIDLQKQITDIKKQAAATATEKAANTQQSFYEYNKEKYGGFKGFFKTIGGYLGNAASYVGDMGGVNKSTATYVPETEYQKWKDQYDDDTSIPGQLKGNIKLLAKQKKELADYEKQNKKIKDDDSFKKQQKEYKDSIAETTSTIADQAGIIQAYIDNLTDGNGRVMSGAESTVKYLKGILNDYENIGKTKDEKSWNNLENYFTASTSGSAMKSYLESIVKSGGSAQDALNAFRASGMRLKDINVSSSTFLKYFEDIKKEAGEASDIVDSFDGTFEGMKTAQESANKGANYDTTMGYYKNVKEMYSKGLWGTDDFKTMAQFAVNYDIGKKLKENASAYKFASDAYVEAWEQGQALLERWYGNEDELTNMQNVLADFQSAGLASNSGDEWSFKNDDGSMKFKTTAEAADKLKTSVSNVELAMSKLEEHGFEFDGIKKSGELLSNYKSSLDGIQGIYESMADGDTKDRLGKLLESWNSEYEHYSENLDELSDDQIVKIKFEYDLSTIEQKIQELQDTAEATGDNSDWAAVTVAQKQAIKMLLDKTGLSADNNEGVKFSDDKVKELRSQMNGASEEERANINAQVAAVQTLEENYLKFRNDGGTLNWKDYLNTAEATKAFQDIIAAGKLTADDLKNLFGDAAKINVDVEIKNEKELQAELDKLKNGESITFNATVDDAESVVKAIKNEDGTITYKADIGGVETDVNKITTKDGKIKYTAEFDGKDTTWLENNLGKNETIYFTGNFDGVQKDIQAYKDEDGKIHYYFQIDENSKQELKQETDKTGNIVYTADTTKAKHAVDDVNQKAEQSNPKVNVDADTSKAEEKIDELTKKGSVDLTNRPQVKASVLADMGYENTGDPNSTATVFSSGFSTEDGKKTVVVTPILPNGDVLEPGALEEYANEILDSGKDSQGIEIRTYYGDDSIEKSNRYAAALHEVQDAYYLGNDAQKKALSSLSEYTEEQLKAINLSDDQSSAMEDSMTSLMDSLNIGKDSLSEFVDVLSDMGLIKIDVDDSDAKKKLSDLSSEEIADKVVKLVGEDNASAVVAVWQGLQADDKFTSLTAEDKATTVTTLWAAASADPKFTSLSANDQATFIIGLWNGLNPEQKEAVLNADPGTLMQVAAAASAALDDVDSKNPDPTIKASDMATSVANSVSATLASLDGKTAHTYVYTDHIDTYSSSGSGNKKSGTKKLEGTVYANGTVSNTGHFPKLSARALAMGTLQDGTFLKSSWKTAQDEYSLTGEKGPEIVIPPHSNRWYTVGDQGAEFASIPAGSVVFNHKQTEELLTKGRTNSRAKGNPSLPGLPSSMAYLQGTAYASGGRLPGSGGGTSSGSSGSSSYNNTSSNNTNTSNTNSDTSSKAEETKETLDLIETELDRIKRNIDLVDKTASSTYKNWSKRNEALVSELSQVSNELNVQQQAYDRYIQQANSVGLSEDWASKVRDGRIDIETITDSDLKDKISDYKTWYEKALDCRDAIADLREQESKLYEQKFNNLKDEYDDILDQFDHTQKMLEGYIDLTEAQGYISSSKYYDALIENENEKLNNLTSKRNDLINSLDEALASGKIDKYSESWYDMQQEINSVDEAILDCNKNTVEWGNNIRQIGWDIFDKLEDRISDITDEADFLVDLMSSEKMYDDKNGGTITDYGKATLGLHGVKYNTYMQQADEYRKEMEKLQEALNADPHNQDLLDRYDDLKDKQRDLIKNAKDEKDAIKDLVEDGINAELDALQKLIDKYSDLLDNNKDLYDYQKQLEEAQKNIASLEKQREAYRGDTSEEGQSKLQQIENDLADARQDLEETQYERSIADQKKLLDDLYNDYEEMLNLRLDNIDMLVQDVITNVNAESAGIRETLETVSSNVGYNMTESMNTIWSSANNVITTYGDKFSTQLTGVLQAINDLKNLLQQQVDAANKKAQINTTAAKKPSTTTNNKPATKPSTNTNTNQNTTQGNGKVEIGDAVKFLSGSYYYSSDGQTPTGDEMHGQTVYITHINTASWAKKQYHIARDKAGNRPLGWVDISQISGFKNGTDYVPYDQLATVAEDGAEGIVHADGRLEKVKALSESDAVINNKSFRNLLNFSANPVEVIRDAILGNQVIPKDFIDVSTPVAPVTNNVTANNTFNFDINVDKPNNYDEFYSEVMTRFQKDIKAEKVVQHMTFGQLNGKGKLEKYKPQF